MITAYINGELTPGTRIYELDGGHEYKVRLPSGGEFRVLESYNNFINVHYKPSPMDWENTEGISVKHPKISLQLFD